MENLKIKTKKGKKWSDIFADAAPATKGEVKDLIQKNNEAIAKAVSEAISQNNHKLKEDLEKVIRK
jgi:gas vesicle protein